jgi:hypothetical protein
VVLDGYDGAGFTSSARYRPLGAELPPDTTLTVPVRLGTADVAVADGLRGPWLPGQAAVRSVEGLRPAVDPASGSLLLPDGTAGARYRLSWYAAMPGPEQLVDAAMDPEAAGTDVDGALPAAVTTAAAGRCTVRRRRSRPRCCSNAGSATTTSWPAATGPREAGTSSSSASSPTRRPAPASSSRPRTC